MKPPKKQPKSRRAPPQTTPDAPPQAATPAAFPIVGIGASAGGLAAFEAFFSGIPATEDPGMAFVLVQHLAPDHKSMLADLIRHYTCMQVFEVEDGMVVQPNCTYIIPPGYNMAFLNGTLQLLDPNVPHGHRLPIDFFFRTLAEDLHERAICIVLSGTGSDGTLGLTAIKNEGGMVMVQSPESAEYDGMPKSAIATGLADFTLPPTAMAAQLMAYTSRAYTSHAFRSQVGAMPAQASPLASAKAENALKKVFILLRTQTGHDFSDYKSNSIHRRIERRMVMHQIDTLDDYVKYLQQSTPEVETLFHEMLIGVTRFFRDPEAFQVLETQVLPAILARKQAGGTVRGWVPGCSTGEEAYSIAILLQERMEALKIRYDLQLFATDIDNEAIAKARTGVFPAGIAADITPERLARFFTLEPDSGNYRIHKSIRDMLVFSEQSVIKDPPFSKLDLISCRNLLIYLNGDLQKKLMPLFHYALNPDGVLFLGTSETIGEFGNLFSTLDRSAKFYQSRGDFYGSPQRVSPSILTLPRSAQPTPLLLTGGKTPHHIKPSLRDLTEQTLLRQIALVAALVNGQGDVLYLHGRSGMYLEPAPGETATNNVLKMAREGLKHELTTALHTATVTHRPVSRPGLRVKTNGHYTTANLRIQPLQAHSASESVKPLYLVILEEAPQTEVHPTAADPGSAPEVDARIAALTQELETKDEYIRSTQDELETSNEELKSSNEELQSINEELQSTNEELETSKKELQSVNEELTTINTQLQSKLVDISRINNDINNLIAGTGIATVFVDLQLLIMRYTPTASAILNLIPGDMGRPVGHLATNLIDYENLVADTQEVLDTLTPLELSVQTRNGAWFSLRIIPYRTTDNVIEGVVITFVNISKIKQAEEALQKANDQLRLAVVVRDAHDAVTVQDLTGRIIAWNPAATRIYGWSEAEALMLNSRERIPQNLREGALSTLAQLSQAEVLAPYRTLRLTKDGATVKVSIISTALLNADGEIYAIATTEREIAKK
ncbi:MAG: chemotaxis protein CheB [Verrucomicrobiota bacterium]